VLRFTEDNLQRIITIIKLLRWRTRLIPFSTSTHLKKGAGASSPRLKADGFPRSNCQ